MKILFVINEIEFADHIAISYLSAIAKELDHSTYICILTDNNLINKIKEIKPDVVAYSVNITGYKNIIKQHKIAKQKFNFISIMGGPQSTFYPETFIESGMDAYCVGEGEYAFRDFLIKIENKESFDNIENLITKKRKNDIRYLIENLDELPEADRDLIFSNTYLKDSSKKTFYATRGCPYNCNYCCNYYYNNLYRGKGSVIRRFSVERLIKEIENVKLKYRMDFVKFGDDIFILKADKWLEEFAEKYKKRINIPFNCYLRFDIVNDDVLKLLKKAGCYSVHLSVDSISPYLRENILNRKMKKNINIEEKLRKIREYGINTWVNYMLGIPGSTIENDLETIMMSKRSRVTFPHYSITDPIKGTRLFEYCVENNIIDPSHEGFTDIYRKSVLSCFSDKEKNIQENICLVGSFISKLPFPFYKIAIWLIKIIPPNKIFRKINKWFYNYNITHTIYKILK